MFKISWFYHHSTGGNPCYFISEKVCIIFGISLSQLLIYRYVMYFISICNIYLLYNYLTSSVQHILNAKFHMSTKVPLTFWFLKIFLWCTKSLLPTFVFMSKVSPGYTTIPREVTLATPFWANLLARRFELGSESCFLTC